MAETAKGSAENPLMHGVKAVGEAFVIPGSSLILDGNLKSGALHALGGIVARSFIGPLGWAVVAANSFSQSVTGRHIHQHFMKGR